MMQEVSCDDTNGESTFEFVEDKMEGLALAEAPTTIATPTPLAGVSSTGPSASAQASPSIPPPSSLPTFITNPHSAPTETTSSFPNPLSSTIEPAAPAFNPANPVSAGSPPRYPPPPNMYQVVPGPVLPAQAYPPVGMYSAPIPTVGVQPNLGYVSSEIPVQAQPVPLYSTPGSMSTSVDVPFGEYDAQPHTPTSPSDNRGGLFGWIKDTVSGSDFLTKVAEKAKNSVDTMITTLDPQMKDYLYSGGDIDIVVASDKESKVGAIREAFQVIFGRASVLGVPAEVNIADQPVGFSAGLKGAEERIHYLRQGGFVHQHQVVVAIESFLVELTPDRWYDMGCLLLQDFNRSITLHMYTQPTPVPAEAVQQIQDETPADYPMRWSGYGVTIGKVMSQKYQVPHTEWHQAMTGTLRRDMIFMAAKTLASQYKQFVYSQT